MSRTEVVDAIRQAILKNELVPGQRLVELELCTTLGASRGSVRAALMDLVHENLVEHIANCGARVRVVGLEEALNIAEVRLAVESLCVARAAERITDSEVRELGDLAREIKDRAETGDVAGFVELTHKVFQTYVRIADQPVAGEFLERLWARNTRQRFRVVHRPARIQTALPYWLDIIDAICRRDSAASQQALRRYATNVQEAMKAVGHERKPFGNRPALAPATRSA